MFGMDREKYVELFSAAVSEKVQLKLLDIISSVGRRVVLQETVRELAEMICEVKPGLFDIEAVTLPEILNNVGVLATEYQIGDANDEGGYKVRTLPPAIANKVWQIQTDGRGSVKTISKINRETDTVCCFVELRDGERVISRQMEGPILHTGMASPEFEAQQTANQKLGKCLADAYRIAGIGYYPSPKDDEAEETSALITGVMKHESSAAASTKKEVTAASAKTVLSAATDIASVAASKESIAASVHLENVKKEARKDEKENEKSDGNTATAVDDALENSNVQGKINIPDNYPSIEEAGRVRSSLLNGHPEYGDNRIPAKNLVVCYKRLLSNGCSENDSTEIGMEMRALRVLISINSTATAIAAKYVPQLFR